MDGLRLCPQISCCCPCYHLALDFVPAYPNPFLCPCHPWPVSHIPTPYTHHSYAITLTGSTCMHMWSAMPAPSALAHAWTTAQRVHPTHHAPPHVWLTHKDNTSMWGRAPAMHHTSTTSLCAILVMHAPAPYMHMTSHTAHRFVACAKSPCLHW